MNKTLNINLAGTLFCIDENAYNFLKSYLEAVEKSIRDVGSRKEIMNDIELRIAELLSEQLNSLKEIVGEGNIQKLIQVMGRPEDYEMEAETPYEAQISSKKHFYRDLDNSVFGGVCAGLAHYFSISRHVLRVVLLLLALFSWGGFIVVYIALWTLVPGARTTSQKLQMSGKFPNLENIKKKFKEGVDEVSESIKRKNYGGLLGKIYASIEGLFSKIFHLLEILLKSILRVLRKIIGIFLLLFFGTLILLSTLAFVGFFFRSSFFTDFPISNYVNFFLITSIPHAFVFSAVFLTVIIPLFLFFGISIRILENSNRALNKPVFWVFFSVWIVALSFSFLLLLASQMYERSEPAEVVTEERFKIQQKGISLEVSSQGDEPRKIYISEEEQQIQWMETINLDIIATKDTLPALRVIKKSHASSEKNAMEYARKIDYTYYMKEDGNLVLSDYFWVDLEDKFRLQRVDLELLVPEGYTIHFPEDIQNSLLNINRREGDDDNQQPRQNFWKISNGKFQTLGSENEGAN